MRRELVFLASIVAGATLAQDRANCKSAPTRYWDPMMGGMCMAIPSCPEKQTADASKPPCLKSEKLSSTKTSYHVHFNQFVGYREATGLQKDPLGEVDSTGMFMLGTQRNLSKKNKLGVELMGSTERWTIPEPRGLVQPFQIGDRREDGSPYIDFQHNHRIGATVSDSICLTDDCAKALVISWGPLAEVPGVPFAGHRVSGYRNMLIPNGHHDEDSTHQTLNVGAAEFKDGENTLAASVFSGYEQSPMEMVPALKRPDSYAFTATRQVCRSIRAGVTFAKVLDTQEAVGRVLAASQNETRFAIWEENQNKILGHELDQTTLYGQVSNAQEHSTHHSFLHEGTLLFRQGDDALIYRIEVYNRKNGDLGANVPNSTPLEWQLGGEKLVKKFSDFKSYFGIDWVQYRVSEPVKAFYQNQNPHLFDFHVRIEFKHSN